MKIFDSFIFFNELELLDLRLNVLNDVVDYFVLTESPLPLVVMKNHCIIRRIRIDLVSSMIKSFTILLKRFQMTSVTTL